MKYGSKQQETYEKVVGFFKNHPDSTVSDACRQMNLSKSNYYQWRQKHILKTMKPRKYRKKKIPVMHTIEVNETQPVSMLANGVVIALVGDSTSIVKSLAKLFSRGELNA